MTVKDAVKSPILSSTVTTTTGPTRPARYLLQLGIRTGAGLGRVVAQQIDNQRHDYSSWGPPATWGRGTVNSVLHSLGLLAVAKLGCLSSPVIRPVPSTLLDCHMPAIGTCPRRLVNRDFGDPRK